MLYQRHGLPLGASVIVSCRLLHRLGRFLQRPCVEAFEVQCFPVSLGEGTENPRWTIYDLRLGC